MRPRHHAPPGAASGLEWHRHKDSFVGTVDGVSRFLLDPSADGDWILWAVNPTTGVQTRKLGRYPTAADAKDAARSSGRAVSEARPRARPATRRSTARVMKLASELSRETNGSPPKPIPGGYRWSEQNESAQFTTFSPEYHQKVVVVVSIFADGSAAVDFFGDEGTSETTRYENVGHFTYSSRTDLPEMVKDIQWVWETVDGYAASWQEDDGGEVDEARGPWKWTVKGSHSGKVLHANGYDITSSQKEWKRWNPVPPFAVWRGQELVGDGFTTLEDAKRAARQADEGGEVDEARRPADDAPMTAHDFVEALRGHLQVGDRQVHITVQPGYGFKRDESVYVNFINLPEGIGGAAGGAEAENNRASFWVRGWPGVGEPSSKVRVENPNSALYGAGAPSRETRVSMRAKSGSPAAVARYLADFLNRVARDVPPRFTHTTMEESGTLTPKERSVLLAIADSEYRMGPIEDNEPVWSNDIDVAGISPRSMGGVFASLQKKGLINLGGSGKEATVNFTPDGIATVLKLREGGASEARRRSQR